MIQILFPDGKSIDVPPGTNLLDAIIKAGLPIGSSCGADAICAKCYVQILEGSENLSKPNPTEKKLIARDKLPAEGRISCLTKVVGPGPVKVTTTYW